jgi:hypothetical protein
MFEQFKNIRAPYEVVKTVGFELETASEDGKTEKFKLRLDVIRFLEDGALAPVIWQVADTIGDVLMLHTPPGASPIRGETPEEVIAAVLRSFHQPE